MNNLVISENQQAVTTSLKVAESFNKTHGKVIRSIENILGQAKIGSSSEMFKESTYTTKQNKQQKMYYMNRDGFTLLAMGFTGNEAMKFKMQYIEAFNEMEQELKNQNVTNFAQLNTAQQMLAVLNAQQGDLQQINTRIDKVEKDINDRIYVTPAQQRMMNKAVSKRVHELIEQDELLSHWNLISRLYFKHVGENILDWFDVSNRGLIKEKDFEEALDVINKVRSNENVRRKAKKRIDDFKKDNYQRDFTMHSPQK